MAALTTPRETPQKLDGDYGTKLGPIVVETSTTLYIGGVVCTNPSGKAVPGSTGASLICQGVLGNQPNVVPAGSVVSASTGSGTVVEIDRGTFFLDNDPNAPITAADIGHACLLNDDHTVSRLSPANASRCIAGTVVGVNATGTSEPIGLGVWVKLGTVQPFQGTGFGNYV
jgi:hypothetical protein